MERKTNCMIVNFLSICKSADSSCGYFKNGFKDCFFHIDGRCCHASAISSANNIYETKLACSNSINS